MDQEKFDTFLCNALKNPQIAEAYSKLICDPLRQLILEQQKQIDVLHMKTKQIDVQEVRINHLEEAISHSTAIAIDQNEQNSRKNNIRITGLNSEKIKQELSTGNDKADEIDVCLKFFNDDLQLQVKRGDIENAHKLPSRDGNLMICRFHSQVLKRKVMEKRKLLRSAGPTGKISVWDDLTRMKSEAAFEARNMKKEGVIHDHWSYMGKLWIVSKEGVKPRQIFHKCDLADCGILINKCTFHSSPVAYQGQGQGRPGPNEQHRHQQQQQHINMQTMQPHPGRFHHVSSTHPQCLPHPHAMQGQFTSTPKQQGDHYKPL